jgi:hypothetical protein
VGLAERAEFTTGRGVPQLDRIVGASRSDRAPVQTESDGVEPPRVACLNDKLGFLCARWETIRNRDKEEDVVKFISHLSFGSQSKLLRNYVRKTRMSDFGGQAGTSKDAFSLGNEDRYSQLVSALRRRVRRSRHGCTKGDAQLPQLPSGCDVPQVYLLVFVVAGSRGEGTPVRAEGH